MPASPPYVTTPGKSFMLTPLVIAMPQPMAEALGYPQTPLGISDILALAQDPSGWAAKGHPEWGPFRFGKTNPNFSTSGLAETVAQYYAATGKTSDLTLEDLARPEVKAFVDGVESAVVHYGDTTLTFLNNLYRADRRGDPYGYASAVAVEEKSLLDYNRGNPDGILDPGEKPAQAAGPARRDLPEGGDALLRQPAHRPRRAVGVEEPEGRREQVRELRDRDQEPAPRPPVRLPPGQPGGRDRQADRGEERCRPGPAADDARGAEATRARGRHRRVEPGAQEGRACCS